jgi:hypothetical protein
LAAHEITCADDQSATARARELFRPSDFEVWREKVRIHPPPSPAHGYESRTLEQARRWRSKAEECRTIADQMQAPAAKMSFWHMAETYERLADGMDERGLGLSVKRPLTG